MVFMCSIACAFTLVALAAGVTLLIWGFRNDGVGVTLAKVFGFIITILASLMFLSTTYNCLTKMHRGHHYNMGGYHNIHKTCPYKCGCQKQCDSKQFCDRHMKNKLEDKLN